MPSRDSIVSKDDLVRGLSRLGLRSGSHVVVHSRLSAFGHVEGGPRTVIDGLKEVLTESGTLVMPTYSGQVIYFLESLALRAGVNGKRGRGDVIVFHGSAPELLGQVSEVAKEAGITLPYANLGDFLERIRAEGASRHLSRAGWSIKVQEGDEPSVELLRNGPPMPEEDVVPWRMPAWTGLIPDTFWREDGVFRSKQYSGSFAAWGSMAQQVLKGHDNLPGQRPEDHPLQRMKEIGGKVLLMGVDHRVNSTIHVAQWAAFRASKVPLPPSWKEFLKDFQDVDGPLDEIGGQSTGMIGDATIRLADTGRLFQVVAGLLGQRISREPPAGL